MNTQLSIEQKISALEFTLENDIKKMNNATTKRDREMYKDHAEYVEGRLAKLRDQLEQEQMESEEVTEEVEVMDEQDENYPVLNLSECGRFEIEYDIPEGYELSKSFDSWKDANNHIAYLESLDRDPSYIVSILGYYLHDEDYIKVVSKVRTTY